MAKMGVGGFRDAKYSFWGQNDVVLGIIIFLKFYIYQNDVILDWEGPKQRRFE